MLQALGRFMSPPAVKRVDLMFAVTATLLAFALVISVILMA